MSKKIEQNSANHSTREWAKGLLAKYSLDNKNRSYSDQGLNRLIDDIKNCDPSSSKDLDTIHSFRTSNVIAHTSERRQMLTK